MQGRLLLVVRLRGAKAKMAPRVDQAQVDQAQVDRAVRSVVVPAPADPEVYRTLRGPGMVVLAEEFLAAVAVRAVADEDLIRLRLLPAWIPTGTARLTLERWRRSPKRSAIESSRTTPMVMG